MKYIIIILITLLFLVTTYIILIKTGVMFRCYDPGFETLNNADDRYTLGKPCFIIWQREYWIKPTFK